ncbi:restriction endonuclease subunit S [Streptococcus parasanguinis]|nr:restriction endonuclease subunit S [Streptococcus parasanguinis]
MEKPKIRFGQFNDKWKKNKLDTVVDFFDNQRIPIDSGERKSGPYPYYGASGIIDFVDGYIFNGEYVLLAEDGANIILRSSPIAYLSKGKFWLNNHAHIMKMKTGSNEFLIQLLEKQSYEKYNTGTAQPKLNGEVVKKISLHFPSDEEQSAIGTFFRTLDDLLASYKDNLANYQSLRATMLSKMFPKAGQTVPEIRLDGFEGEWEVVILGTLIENYDEIISGASGFPIATSSRKGLYLQNDYFEGGRTGIDLTLDFHRVPMGYVTYRHMSDDSIFKFNKNNFETDVLVSKEYPVFISNDRSDIDFLLYHLNNSGLFLRFSTMQKLGGTRVRLYYKNLITYRLSVPKVKEQQAIGAYFSNLDNLISGHQEKISQLESLKKKLLQDMFI